MQQLQLPTRDKSATAQPQKGNNEICFAVLRACRSRTSVAGGRRGGRDGRERVRLVAAANEADLHVDLALLLLLALGQGHLRGRRGHGAVLSIPVEKHGQKWVSFLYMQRDGERLGKSSLFSGGKMPA